MQTQLRELLQQVSPRLEGLSEAATSRKLNAGTWSPKEILGHLVDSAQHNHGRFVALGLHNGTSFPGDNQDDWVSFQGWQQRPWLEIVALWQAYNAHLAWLIERLPEDRLEHQGTVFLSQQHVTLRWLVEHYLEHLEHHLEQIWQRSQDTHPAPPLSNAHPPFWSDLESLVTSSELHIDRPKGTAHPHRHDLIYPFDYGELLGTSGGDGAGIDVWLGSLEPRITGILATVDTGKRDSETKILLGCSNIEMLEIAHWYNHIAEVQCLLIERPR